MRKPIVVGALILAFIGLAAAYVTARQTDEASPSEPYLGQSPQTKEAERAAIRQAALDYIEGWFEGNAERMDRALHPQLAKRLLVVDAQTGQEKFTHLTKEQMVEFTRRGGGSRVPADKRNIKVTVLDTTETMAFVRSDCSQFIDYLTLAKGAGGGWKIVNVLWENIRQ
jgi:hypothetical protein